MYFTSIDIALLAVGVLLVISAVVLWLRRSRANESGEARLFVAAVVCLTFGLLLILGTLVLVQMKPIDF